MSISAAEKVTIPIAVEAGSVFKFYIGGQSSDASHDIGLEIYFEAAAAQAGTSTDRSLV